MLQTLASNLSTHSAPTRTLDSVGHCPAGGPGGPPGPMSPFGPGDPAAPVGPGSPFGPEGPGGPGGPPGSPFGPEGPGAPGGPGGPVMMPPISFDVRGTSLPLQPARVTTTPFFFLQRRA